MTGSFSLGDVSFHANPLIDRAIKLSLPFGLAALLLLALYLTHSYQEFLILAGLLFVYAVPPAGKETVIPVGIGLGVPWWLIAACTVTIDLCFSLFVAFNLDLTLKIPVLGPFIGKFMTGGRAFLNNRPWLERLSTVGLIIFVIVPFQGSGGMNSTILGRVMGFSARRAVGCVLLGSFISSYAIALGADAVIALFREDLKLGLGAIGLIVLAIVVLWFLWKRYTASLDHKGCT
ncbi:small multi-drug export protein [uncultured Methanofollis sp.]|uniref:small multi-drug export protein n=1 Tax=uncultured Methanofollis sp. TaxID=262500 RepID=UPI0026078461|nr:small multi-drug export protein [uncultured Methanofollis sp.]